MLINEVVVQHVTIPKNYREGDEYDVLTILVGPYTRTTKRATNPYRRNRCIIA